jgi:hypothetical protein
MAKKKNPTLTMTFEVEYSDGPRLKEYESLAVHLAEEWEGHEVYFQDPEKDEETSVLLYVKSAEITTG